MNAGDVPSVWSAAILAGGASTRFGRPKCLVPLAGMSLIRWVAKAAFPPSGDLMVVLECGADPLMEAAVLAELSDISFRVVRDPSDGPRTPARGIGAALQASSVEYVAVVACDMPFVVPALFQLMASYQPGAWAIVPHYRGFFEPLCAMYSRRLLPYISEYRKKPDGPLSSVFVRNPVPVKFLDERDIWRAGDPGILFFNINTQPDLARAEEMIRAGLVQSFL